MSTPTSAATGGRGSEESVRVAVRCRPFNRRERDGNMGCVIEMDNTTTNLIDSKDTSKDPKSFVFDHSYFWDTEQDTVYGDLGKPILNKAMQGYNGTIFAYGQTGSGKSFSMMGDSSNPGIIPRLNQDLFKMVDEMKAQNPSKKFLILVSYLEIYNEVIKDLLNPSDKTLTIREHPKMGVYVQDLAELVVHTAEDVEKLIEQGNKVRRVAATNMNERSSRSHSCFTIKIEQRDVEDMGNGKEKQTTLTAKINLVDLAGSERAEKTGATGDRLKEGAAINKSLSVLGNVINALAEGGKRHIPYRDSKLTRLLQQSLGGNSLTVMIAAISPADDNHDETLSTLQYANRAKNIKNKTTRNEDVTQQIIRELREEIAQLRSLLDSKGNPTNGTMTEESITQMEEMREKIANLQRAQNESWDEKERLSQLYAQEREQNLANEQKIKSFMSSIKEDNKDLLKRLHERVTKNTQLRRKFKKMKESHVATRNSLAEHMQEYEQLDAEGGEDGPNKDRMEEILGFIEELHAQVEEETEHLQALKHEIEENENLLAEEKAEAAAQRMLLEEDAELRKAIQEEERARLEQENEALIAATLEQERKKLKEEAEREKEELRQRYLQEATDADTTEGTATNEKVHELELQLLQANSDKSLMALELDRLKQKHTFELKKIRHVHQREIREIKRKELHMFRELTEGFVDERRQLQDKLNETKKLLKSACDDISYLLQRNQELEKDLQEAVAWEPVSIA